MKRMADSYPLSWPQGWKRTTSRHDARFHRIESGRTPGGFDYRRKKELTIADAAARVLDELKRLGVGDYNVIVSTNVKTSRTGMPYSSRGEPDDPGVAVYWKRRGRQEVMAIDHYDRVADNLAAIAATLHALRAIERHGGGAILERAFTGFVALPAPKTWREVFFPDGKANGQPVSLEDVRIQYKNLSLRHHPDRGGTHEAMAELNSAYEQAVEELS